MTEWRPKLYKWSPSPRSSREPHSLPPNSTVLMTTGGISRCVFDVYTRRSLFNFFCSFTVVWFSLFLFHLIGHSTEGIRSQPEGNRQPCPLAGVRQWWKRGGQANEGARGMEVDGEEINGKFCFFGASIHTVILHSPKDSVYTTLAIYLERSGLKPPLE